MNKTAETPKKRRILWLHVLTVVSAAILIGAEVLGAAFAGGWALENLTGIGDRLVSILHFLVSLFGVDLNIPAAAGVFVLQALFFLIGIVVMAQFIRAARRVEPFTASK